MHCELCCCRIKNNSLLCLSFSSFFLIYSKILNKTKFENSKILYCSAQSPPYHQPKEFLNFSSISCAGRVYNIFFVHLYRETKKELSHLMQLYDKLNSPICVDFQGNMNSTILVSLSAHSSAVQKIQKQNFLWTL